MDATKKLDRIIKIHNSLPEEFRPRAYSIESRLNLPRNSIMVYFAKGKAPKKPNDKIRKFVNRMFDGYEKLDKVFNKQ